MCWQLLRTDYDCLDLSCRRLLLFKERIGKFVFDIDGIWFMNLNK
jgi:hypothetical protein